MSALVVQLPGESVDTMKAAAAALVATVTQVACPSSSLLLSSLELGDTKVDEP